MTAHRGYFSLIQYCPDASRLEAANVGVVLFCPELGFLEARTSQGNDRVRRFFGRETFDPASLSSAKQAMERRLIVERDNIRSPEQFQHFIDTRANELKLTPPRPMKVLDPAKDLQNLFDELVGGRAKREKREAKKVADPRLQSLFERLAQAGKAKLNYSVEIPILGRELKVPYAFQNGVLNLVKPHLFIGNEKHIVDSAMMLGGEGDILQNETAGSDGESKLIVVSSFDPARSPTGVSKRVTRILEAFHVRSIPEQDVAKFVKEVERSAHLLKTHG